MQSKTLGEQDAAEYLGISYSKLRALRYMGIGPVAIAIGRNIRYLISDLDDFLNSLRQKSA